MLCLCTLILYLCTLIELIDFKINDEIAKMVLMLIWDHWFFRHSILIFLDMYIDFFWCDYWFFLATSLILSFFQHFRWLRLKLLVSHLPTERKLSQSYHILNAKRLRTNTKYHKLLQTVWNWLQTVTKCHKPVANCVKLIAKWL